MARLLVGLVLLGAALSVAAQEMPGIPTGKSAPPFRVRDQFAKENTCVSDGTQRSCCCSSLPQIGDPSTR